MTYHSFCQKCRKARELTEETFKKLLTKKLRMELNQREKTGEAIYAKLKFTSGCPDCVGAKGENMVEVVIGKKKPTQH